MMTREKRIKVLLSSYFCVEQHAGEEEGRSRVLILEFFLFPDKQVENNWKKNQCRNLGAQMQHKQI